MLLVVDFLFKLNVSAAVLRLFTSEIAVLLLKLKHIKENTEFSLHFILFYLHTGIYAIRILSTYSIPPYLE